MRVHRHPFFAIFGELALVMRIIYFSHNFIPSHTRTEYKLIPIENISNIHGFHWILHLFNVITCRFFLSSKFYFTVAICTLYGHLRLVFFSASAAAASVITSFFSAVNIFSFHIFYIQVWFIYGKFIEKNGKWNEKLCYKEYIHTNMCRHRKHNLLKNEFELLWTVWMELNEKSWLKVDILSHTHTSFFPLFFGWNRRNNNKKKNNSCIVSKGRKKERNDVCTHNVSTPFVSESK